MTRKKAQITPAQKKDDPTISAVFVFGTDENGQTRGARFLEARPEIETAAQDLGLRVITNVAGAFADLAMRLPLGRMYASGKAFIPNIRPDLCNRLTEFEKTSIQAADAVAAGVAAEALNNLIGVADTGPVAALPTYPALPSNWSEIDVDHLVLIHGGADVGWWPAVVTQRQENILTLRLRDYPQQGTFLRHRFAVGLFNPGRSRHPRTD